MLRSISKVILPFCIPVVWLGWSFRVSAQEPVSPTSLNWQHDKGPITVADAIGMTKVADRLQSDLAGNIAQFSPDGKKFVVVLRKGNLKHNTNDYALLLWNAGTLFTPATAPEVIVRMSSSSNREGIADVRWSGNEALTFLGENPGEPRQIYSFNLRSPSSHKHPLRVSGTRRLAVKV